MTSGANDPAAAAGGCPGSAARAANRRSSHFFETSSLDVASLPKAPRGSAMGSVQAVAIPFFCAAREGEACMRSKAEQLWRASGKAFVVTLEVQSFEQRDGSKISPGAGGGRGTDRARFPGVNSTRERELSTRTEFLRRGLTATAADDSNRSAGRLASPPTFRPVSSFSSKCPADLFEWVAADTSSHDATRVSTDHAPSRAFASFTSGQATPAVPFRCASSRPGTFK